MQNRKSISVAAKEFPDLSSLTVRAREAFLFSIKNSKTKEEMKSHFQHSVQHWSGNHSNCKHPPKQVQKYKLTNKGTSKLWELFESHGLSVSDKLLHGKTTNIAEAFNSLIAYYAPKHKSYKKKYPHLINLAILHKFYSFSFPLLVIQQLGFIVCDDMKQKFLNVVKQREKELKKKQTTTYKTNRVVQKKKKQKLQQNDGEYYYKDQDEKIKNISCKCTKSCMTNRCKCRKNEASCSINCQCGENCKNYYNETC